MIQTSCPVYQRKLTHLCLVDSSMLEVGLPVKCLLAFKVLATNAADDVLIFVSVFFQRKKTTWHFM